MKALISYGLQQHRSLVLFYRAHMKAAHILDHSGVALEMNLFSGKPQVLVRQICIMEVLTESVGITDKRFTEMSHL